MQTENARLFHELPLIRSRKAGESAALTAGDVTLTYEELSAEVLQLAGGLAKLGVRRGDRVAIYLQKRTEMVVAMLGAATAGGMFIPVNPVLKSQQVAHILRDSGAKVLVTSTARQSLLEADLAECDALEHVVLVADTPDASVSGSGVAWETVLEGGDVDAPLVLETDPAAILYTSGSTGRPKGVVLSHRNLIVGAQSVASYLGNVPEDRILCLLPLSFDAGLSQITTAFTVGAHAVLLDYLLARDVPKTCERHAITGITGVPPLWMQLADTKWPDAARASLRYFATTGGKMPRDTLGKLRAHFPQAAPFLMYGLTEAFRSTYLDPDEVDRRPDSIGKAIPNAEVMVVRPDGTECDPDEPGELVHRGPLVSLGYWNDPETTSVRFRPAPGQPEGLPSPEIAVWSGDMVKKDADGFLYFVSRADEMIKTSGYRVSPTEIEEVAYSTGLVTEAAAFGLPSDRLGEVIHLVVVPASADVTAEQLINEYRARLPAYMTPAAVDLRETLPRNPNGKIDRKQLKDEALNAEAGPERAKASG